MDALDDDDWDRTVVVIDRLAALGSSARTPFSRSLPGACSSSGSRSGRRLRESPTGSPRTAGSCCSPRSASNATTSATRSPRARQVAEDCARDKPRDEDDMANHSRWDDVKRKRTEPAAPTRAAVEQDLA